MTRINEQSFRKGLKTKMTSSCFLVAFGVFIYVTVFYLSKHGIVTGNHKLDFTNGFYTGIGSAFIGSGCALIIRSFILLNNPKRFEKAYTEYADERSRFIFSKVAEISATIMLFILPAAAIIAGFSNQFAVFVTLLICDAVFGAIILVTSVIIKKRY